MKNKIREQSWYIFAVTFSVTTVIVSLMIPDSLLFVKQIRMFFGLFSTLFLPGYVFNKALFAKKENGNIEMMALSFGTSMIIVSITALLLGFSSWGITSHSITLSLFIFTVSSATIALLFDLKK